MENKTKEYYTIDVLHIVKSLWSRIWLIGLCALLAALIGFSLAAFIIQPSYSSSIMLYVNNSSFTLGESGFSISSSEIAAAQNLVRTYSVILNNRTTLDRVIDETGVSYTYQELFKMIKTEISNNTEIMKVTVTTGDPEEAALIANGIAEVLPERVAEIINGASMKVVDYAIPVPEKVGPSITKYTLVAFVLGFLLSVMALTVAALLDDTIHDEKYVLQNYKCPVLAKIPDLRSSGGNHHGYYYQQSSEAGQ